MAELSPSSKRRALRHVMVLAGFVVAAGGAFRLASKQRQGRGRHRTPPSPQALHAGHETKDINVRGTTMILAGMAATTALVVGITFVMIWRFHVSQNQGWAKLTVIESAHSVPPGPHLEVNPLARLARHLAVQKHLLNTYGWASPDHTIARIPIDRAMILMAGKSLDAAP